MKAVIKIAVICMIAGGVVGVISLASKRAVTATRVNTSEASNPSPAAGIPSEQVIHISAKKFEFTPSSITLKKGVPVTLELRSEDREHGFSLRAFGVRAVVKAGEVSSVHFTPDKVGQFHFSCDVFCGDGHEDMTGTVIVKE